MLRSLFSWLSLRRALIVVASGATALVASTAGVAAQSIEVAEWTGASAVSGCVYNPGVAGTFSCSSVGSTSSVCTYVIGSSITGICSANLGSGSITNAAYSSASWSQNVGGVREVVTEDTCAHGATQRDGTGVINFAPLSGGPTPQPVPVTLHITTTGHSVFVNGNLDTQLSTPVTVSYSGATLDVGTGGFVTSSGSLTFTCGLASSTGSFAGQLSGTV
jgi:hypothetical protein